MKKILLGLIIVLALTGCQECIDGKYDTHEWGAWEDKLSSGGEKITSNFRNRILQERRCSLCNTYDSSFSH